MTVQINTIGQITFLVADTDIAARAEFNLDTTLTSEQFSTLLKTLGSQMSAQVTPLVKEPQSEIEKAIDDFFPDDKKPTSAEVNKAFNQAKEVFKGKAIVPTENEEMGAEGAKLLIKDYIAQTGCSRDDAKAYVRAILERNGCNYEDQQVYGLDADVYMKAKSEISKLKKASK